VTAALRGALGLGTDRKAFALAHPHLFLVKRPAASPDGEASPIDGAIAYKTRHINDDAAIDAAAFAGQWWVAEVRKREGNPFPERISLGRAPNCDIVVRTSFVSKLHAHFLVGEGNELRLSDQRSANGTSLNGRELVPGVSAIVRAGDTVRFGAVELELMDAGALFDLLSRSQP